MSVFSDEEPTGPQDPLHYAPRRRGERSGMRLRTATSPIGETKFDRPFSIEASSSPFGPSESLDAEFADAFSESLRRHLDPHVMPEPAAFVRERSRRKTLLRMGGGIALAVGAAAVAALLLVTMVMPASRDRGAVAGLAAAAEFALPHWPAKPAPSQPRSLPVSSGSDQALTHQQSEQLLDRFIQWRQKTDAAQQQQ
jgi:hypothetical protein